MIRYGYDVLLDGHARINIHPFATEAYARRWADTILDTIDRSRLEIVRREVGPHTLVIMEVHR